jgi:GGDEF domain-containing protein
MAHAGVRDSLTLIRGATASGTSGARAPIPLIPAHPGYEHLTREERAQRPGVATRNALLERLTLLEAIAPSSPVSFLLVLVDGLTELEQVDAMNTSVVTAEVAAALSRLTTPMDLVGRFENATFGIVLQGRGAGSAALMSARIHHHLNALPIVRFPVEVRVAVATGTGDNHKLLITAATDALAGSPPPAAN